MKKLELLAALAVTALLLTGCEDPKQKAFEDCVDKQVDYVASHYSEKQIRDKQAEVELAIMELCEKKTK